jgi:hypothetical protein
MVLHCIQDETRLHRFNSRWEGSFIMHKVIGLGSYRLQYPNGQEVPNSWNIKHLRCFILSQPRHHHVASCIELLIPTWRNSSSLPSGQPWHFRVATCEFPWPTQGIVFSRQLKINTSSTTPFYWFTTGTTCSLLHGSYSYTPSTTPFIGSQLVLRASLLKGPYSYTSSNAKITSFRLIFYVTEGTSLPYFKYYSIYWLTTGIRANLEKRPRSHSSSNAQITSFWLVFYVT